LAIATAIAVAVAIAIAIALASFRGRCVGRGGGSASSRSKWPRVACVGLVDQHSSAGARLDTGALVEREAVSTGLALGVVCAVLAVDSAELAIGAVFIGPRGACGKAGNLAQQFIPVHAVEALVGPCAVGAVGNAGIAHLGLSVYPGAVGAVVHACAVVVNEICIASEALVRLIAS